MLDLNWTMQMSSTFQVYIRNRMQRLGEVADLKIFPAQNNYPDILDSHITDITIIL